MQITQCETPLDAVNHAIVRHALISTAETFYALKSRGCLAALAKGSGGGVGRAKPKGRSF